MNSSEMLAREKKAAKLAAVLFKSNVTAEDIANATSEEWAMAAESAGCHPPHSQATIDMILANLVRMQAESAEDRKADDKWEESQEYGGNRCPERE